MKIAHLIRFISEEASGPSYSIPRLCQSEALPDNVISLYCGGSARSVDGVEVKVYSAWKFLKKLSVSPEMVAAVYRDAACVDIVHNHSLWSMVNVVSGWAVPGRGAKLVVSPRGTLSPWALNHSKRVKKVVWPFQKRALLKADLLHATSDKEYEEIRTIGLKSPVAIIPNGIDIPPLNSLKKANNSGKKTLLYLSRIHPIKGLERLLNAWSILQDKYPDWQINIVGKGSPDYEQKLKDMADSLGLERMLFCGPKFGEDKSGSYFSSDLFILPTHTENFSVAVAEALAHGCPAIVTQGAPWSGLEEEGCGWWVENTQEAVTRALDSAMSLPRERLVEMGLSGRAWMERAFGWQGIGERMLASYQWLLDGGEPPEWVRVE